MTVVGLTVLLLERTGIPPWHQQLRVGFPPVVLRCDDERLLHEAGIHDGEVVHLDNLHDLFLRKLESGAYTMAELIDALPPEEDKDATNNTGVLFMEALITLGIDLEETNFWDVVRGKMQHLLADETDSIPEVQLEELRAGLFLLQRLFHNHDPRERLSLIIDCLPGRGDQALGSVQLYVNRENMLISVAPRILQLDRHQLRSPIRIKFLGEAGIDWGGLVRNFFSDFATRLGDDEPTLWRYTGRGSLQPTADVVSERAAPPHPSGLTPLELYRACGRVFGMAVLIGTPADPTMRRQFFMTPPPLGLA